MLSRLLSLDSPVVIAHRGGSKLRPENTIEAFDHAVALGVDALECDVHLARDGEPVVVHDFTLERTTDASGPVAALTADELASLDAGSKFQTTTGATWSNAGGIPRLATLLGRYPSIPIVVEIKGDRPDVAERTVALIREVGAEDRVLIGGFSDGVLQAVRSFRPKFVTSASSAEVQSALRRALFRIAPRRSGFDVFQVPVRLRGRVVLNRSLVTVARRAGVPVHAWIVDDAEEMRRLRNWGVTGLITDRPDVALDVVRSERAQP